MYNPNAIQQFFTLVMFFGMFIMTIGSIWLYIETARENILWLLACLFVPIASFAFLLLHFDRAAKPTAVIVLGAVVTFGAALLSGGGGPR